MAVANVYAIHQKENIFGYVGRVVGNALQIVGDEHQVNARVNGTGVLLHEADQFLVHSVLKIVHFIVSGQNTLRHFGIPLDERIQTFLHHGFH